MKEHRGMSSERIVRKEEAKIALITTAIVIAVIDADTTPTTQL